jgi:hypothetical protein
VYNAVEEFLELGSWELSETSVTYVFSNGSYVKSLLELL